MPAPMHHYGASKPAIPYGVWAEDQDVSPGADNVRSTIILAGTTDYYTKTDGDENVDKIQAVFDAEIRPGLKADGGDAELLDVDGDKVQVRLQGRCASCAIADKTIEHWIEAKLREQVSPAISVVQVQ